MNPCNQCLYQLDCTYYDKAYGRELKCDCFIDINMFTINYKNNKSIWREMSYNKYKQNWNTIDNIEFNIARD